MLILRLARGVGDHFPARASEWGLGAMLLAWGWQLAGPRDAFASPGLDLLGRIAPEGFWAAACIFIGAARLIALLINGTFHDTSYSRWSPHVRALMAGLSGFFWMTIALSLVAGSPTGQGLAVYPILFALDLYNVYRASRDAWHSDESARHAGTG